MKILNSILEILTSPFSIILRNSGNGKNYFASWAKVLIIFCVSAIIVVALILYFYRDIIFQ
ncbi:MAG: hypothetical protein K2H02_01445 [Anaeroplasmataceae bacterium]|nr:hypothetical protein [Anaeroplasmataceae bacterium]MDE5867588.1 hypothetical protein [Anaeroplasmataceae bacterium]